MIYVDLAAISVTYICGTDLVAIDMMYVHLAAIIVAYICGSCSKCNVNVF